MAGTGLFGGKAVSSEESFSLSLSSESSLSGSPRFFLSCDGRMNSPLRVLISWRSNSSGNMQHNPVGANSFARGHFQTYVRFPDGRGVRKADAFMYRKVPDPGNVASCRWWHKDCYVRISVASPRCVSPWSTIQSWLGGASGAPWRRAGTRAAGWQQGRPTKQASSGDDKRTVSRGAGERYTESCARMDSVGDTVGHT